MANHLNILFILFISSILSGCSLSIELLENFKSQNDVSIALKSTSGKSCIHRKDSAPSCYADGGSLKELSFSFPLENETILRLKAGFSNSCVVAASGRAFCWGSNSGTLGDGLLTYSTSPVEVKRVGSLEGRKIVDISPGESHICVLDDLNAISCWGKNSAKGQIGDGTSLDSKVPVAVDTSGVLFGKKMVSLSAHGAEHTCALDDMGKAYCWGNNLHGQLGNGDTTNSGIPVAVDMSGLAAGRYFIKIEVGSMNSCAIDNHNTAYCWGNNERGALGINKTQAILPYSAVPFAVHATAGVLKDKKIVTLEVGYLLVCALTEDRIPVCWGNDGSGQVGNGGTKKAEVAPSKVVVTGAVSGETVEDIRVGFYHACLTTESNRHFCWGSNHFGYLGNGSTLESLEPVETIPISEDDRLASIALENYKSCALSEKGFLYCWGSSSSSDGKSLKQPVMYSWSTLQFPDAELKHIRDYSLSNNHMCFVSASYRLFCNGDNASGQLGISGARPHAYPPTPVDTSGVLNNVNIGESFAISGATFALSVDGRLFGWGRSDLLLASNDSVTQSNVPVEIEFGPHRVKKFMLGRLHACALLDNNKLVCWGDNANGQVGDGTIGGSVNGPSEVKGLPAGKKVTAIFASQSHHSCALIEGGDAYCWGYNNYGKLGHADAEDTAVPKAKAVALMAELKADKIKTMALGNSSSCALTEQGKVHCWGRNNSAQLGVSILLVESAVPQTVETDLRFAKISAGLESYCGITWDEKMYCWGQTFRIDPETMMFTTYSEKPFRVEGL